MSPSDRDRKRKGGRDVVDSNNNNNSAASNSRRRSPPPPYVDHIRSPAPVHSICQNVPQFHPHAHPGGCCAAAPVPIPAAMHHMSPPPPPMNHPVPPMITVVHRQQRRRGQRPQEVVVFNPDDVNYKRKPTRTLCDKCDSLVYTEVQGKAGCGAWAWSVACCVIGLVLGCCLLPFCCRRCRVYKHRCPQCGAEMAKYAGGCSCENSWIYNTY